MKAKVNWLPLVMIVLAIASCATHEHKPQTETLNPKSVNPETMPLPNEDRSLSYKLEDALGRPAKYEITHKKSQGPWTFLCGKPLEMNEQPFDYKNSKLNELYSDGLGDDSFCALMKGENDQLEVIEFDIGSNDMPALEWIETHDIPAEILDD